MREAFPQSEVLLVIDSVTRSETLGQNQQKNRLPVRKSAIFLGLLSRICYLCAIQIDKFHLQWKEQASLLEENQSKISILNGQTLLYYELPGNGSA